MKKLHRVDRRSLATPLVAAAALFLAGCAATPAPPPEPEPSLTALPPTPPLTVQGDAIDYTQRPLAEMSEEDRAAYIEENYPATSMRVVPPQDPFGDDYRHSIAAAPRVGSRTIIERRVVEDPRCWTVIGPDYSPYRERPPRYHRSTHRYVDRQPHYAFPANTVLYGTLGGIIGHQSDHRDEGILIGGTYGLLLDMMRW